MTNGEKQTVRTNVEFEGGGIADGLASCIGERRLWSEVITQAFYRATIGEQSALHFFSSTMFTQLASMLSLPASDIRERVIAKAAVKLQQKTNREN